MSTKISIKEANGDISSSKQVNGKTPLDADNMNALLDGVRDNLKNIDNINHTVSSDLPLSTAPETGMIFINNTLKWQEEQEIDSLFLILDGGGIETIEKEISYTEEN